MALGLGSGLGTYFRGIWASFRTGQVRVVGPIFWKQEYGIALQPDSPYLEAVNQALLRVIEKGEFQLLYNEWFGS